MAACIKEEAVLNPKTIESQAIFRGSQQCLHLGISNLILESDCQTVMNALQNPQESHSLLSNLFCDIKALVAMFQHFSIHFDHRECNTAIHRLAKFALECTPYHVMVRKFLNFYPSPIGWTKNFVIPFFDMK